MKKYVFLFINPKEPQADCLCEQKVEAVGMYDAFTKVQKIANDYVKDTHSPLKIELKEVQYFDEVQYVDAL
ncbi:hypothetical protein P9265_06525 [Schinkia azotoformans]|uniref:hypothetical protein n=1 Tax=Schinkia azotoformans TaxID=1454 RepID=UPI002DBBB370|nr:hypothetical protein [Schinkia azotoformans]MEC1721601.1 hypothetical protein [Schinkia azotoformans]MED4351989.1 hypothetical protein [Schinkia azotoformans]MED4413600.1 hypothetical protein [Schinkia azotoformans]